MKRLKKSNILLLAALFLAGFCSKAQSTASDSALQRLFDSDVLLPLLVDSAIKNSPQIRHASDAIKLSEQGIESSKKSIFNGLSFFSNYSYGNATDLNMGKDVTINNQYGNYLVSKSNRYQLGVNLQIPLSSILLRKNTIRTAEMQVKVVEDERDNYVMMVKQEVIRLYQELKLSHRLLMTSSTIRQSAYANYSMTQKDFLKANNDLEQFSRIQEMYLKSSMENDMNVNRFQTAFLQLQAFTGIQLGQLIKGLR